MNRHFLFNPIHQGHDGKNRPVFICEDEFGQYVYKPQTGFRSKHYAADSAELQECFTRVQGCNAQNAFYEPDEVQAKEEKYPSFSDKQNQKIPAVVVVPEGTTPAKEVAAKTTAPKTTANAKDPKAVEAAKAAKAEKLKVVKTAKAAAKASKAKK